MTAACDSWGGRSCPSPRHAITAGPALKPSARPVVGKARFRSASSKLGRWSVVMTRVQRSSVAYDRAGICGGILPVGRHKPQPRFVSDAREFGAPIGQSIEEHRRPLFHRIPLALRAQLRALLRNLWTFGQGRSDDQSRGRGPCSGSERALRPMFLAISLPVPAETGASDGDLEEEYRSASWRVLLTEAEYDETVAYIRQLQAKSKCLAGVGLQLQRICGGHRALHGL